MLLILHVGVALTSIAYAAYVFFSPSKSKLYTTYALIGATVATGTILTLQNPTHIPQACSVGLLYLTAMFIGIALIRTKLSRVLSE